MCPEAKAEEWGIASEAFFVAMNNRALNCTGSEVCINQTIL